MLHQIIQILHVLVAISLVAMVLIQHGKGADAGAAFGSGASSTVFGSRGSGSVVTRITTVLAVIFFSTSLTLAMFSRQYGEPESVMDAMEALMPAPELVTEPVDAVRVPGDVPVITEDPVLDTGGGASDLPAIPEDSPAQ